MGGVLIVTSAALVAFYVAPTRPPAATGPQITARKNASPPAPPTSTAVTQNSTALAGEFATFQAGLHAKVGVVVRAVGAKTEETLGSSDFSDQPAWSTIKVPLVIASMRQHGDARPTPAMVSAITESDNVAAEAIWESMGDPATAATAVGKVLHEAGDPTIVQSQKLRPEYTAFGQTNWALANQAMFLAAAACDVRSQPALELMGRVAGDQRWGLGSLPDAKIKGGWGPSPSGRYLVRQIAIVPAGQRGLTVVAMAASPDSGSFADGTRVLTQIGEWLNAHLTSLPAAKCVTGGTP